MSLDISQIVEQLNAVLGELRERDAARIIAERRAVEIVAADPVEAIEDKIARSGRALALRTPAFGGRLGDRHRVACIPDDFAVIAADGSAINVDRHSPLGCYVINVGWAVIRYGSQPDCVLNAESSLEVRRLTYVDPEDHAVRPIDGQLLGIQLSIAEFERVAELVEGLPPDLPAVAMMDNPLTIWGLASPQLKGFIRATPADGGPSLLERYEKALARVERACQVRQAALVGYVSRPSLVFVSNLVRVFACPHSVADCKRYCPSHDPDERDCNGVATTDAEMFFRYLRAGERSGLFHPRDDGGERVGPDIWFCYLHTGSEVARIELPDWVARDPERLELALSLVLDQVARGQGYPAALIEAHECAVISVADRQMFARLVGNTVAMVGMSEAGSAKAASKRTRGV
ncbi:MAG: DNA double-strand break repair nuclease NurA [Dehalococcoidia bacterium]